MQRYAFLRAAEPASARPTPEEMRSICDVAAWLRKTEGCDRRTALKRAWAWHKRDFANGVSAERGWLITSAARGRRHDARRATCVRATKGRLCMCRACYTPKRARESHWGGR